uniref:TlpA family protein disulfide reductase n=1 Tax=uncultured Wocania sp. TaxID=2834404 RepID=UPI0030FBBCA9
VTLSGKITDKNSDSLVVRNRTYSKTLKVGEDGTFKDTLKVETGTYNFFDGKESTSIFLKNGYDLNISIDTKEFDESITYSGIGSESSNYLAKQALIKETAFPPGFFDLDEEAFKAKVNEINKEFSDLLGSFKDLDSTLIAKETEQISKMPEQILSYYKQQKERASMMAELIGKPSPTFDSYENNAGGTTSLVDLKGKYVYVDVWATWCGPCKAEIPFLKEVEKKYHDKNIEFVSISVDKAKDHDKWKTMVVEKELSGIQLFADKDWSSDFVKGYGIRGIPRFILIDPTGNIVNADAPRPSDPKLIEVFESLNI